MVFKGIDPTHKRSDNSKGLNRDKPSHRRLRGTGNKLVTGLQDRNTHRENRNLWQDQLFQPTWNLVAENTAAWSNGRNAEVVLRLVTTFE